MSVGSVESVKDSEVKEIPLIPRISPRIIPGFLTAANKGAIDWGWQSFVAYGCQNHVVVIDSQYIKVFQTLQKHRADVIKVKWSKDSFYHSLTSPFVLKLASADNVGNLVVWNVTEGTPISSFMESSKPVQEIEWLTGQDACHHYLVALHPPYSLIIWDTDKGTKLWKKSYTETLLSFAFDPFADNRMAFLAADCILFVDDFNIIKTPSSNGRKFYISNPSSKAQTSNDWSAGESKTRSYISRRMKFLVRADSKLTDDGVSLNECLQLSYHRSYRQHLLLLYPREILVLDLDINQTVGIISVDQNSSNIMQMYSCWQRDAFYILQENGCVSFRIRHRGHKVMAAATPSFNSADTTFTMAEPSLELGYDLYSMSDSLRLTKHAKVIGIAVCPKSENKVSLLISDGRMLFFDLMITQQEFVKNCWAPHLSTIIPPIDKNLKPTETIPFPTTAYHPANTLSDNIAPALYPCPKYAKSYREAAKFKLFITGYLYALAPPQHVIKMCPPVTYRNWKMYQPLMAVGNASGSIQVLNMATGLIAREFSVHTFAVRGIEWIGLTSFLSYAHTNIANNLGHVRNELVLTDIQSGRTKSLRGEHQEESPIEMIRVSHLRQYVIIAFKEEPLELWDLRLLTLLRTMPKNFPFITALEWSSVHKKQQSSFSVMIDELKEPVSSEYISDSDMLSKSLTYRKENFIFPDTNGQLHHFSVEGNLIQDGKTIPIEAGVECVTCLAWKGDIIVLGYVDGTINLLSIKEKCLKTKASNRGWIKKIRFGPGKGNLKAIILYNDGIDVINFSDMSLVESIRCPRDMSKICDIDWAGSDCPCFATADGCIRITDVSLKEMCSPINNYEPTGMAFSPCLLPVASAFGLRSYLQHFNMKKGPEKEDLHSLSRMLLDSLEPSFLNFLQNCPFGTAERSLHISRLFGDEEACRFWTVALYYLKDAKIKEIKSKTDEESLDAAGSKNDSSILFFEQPLDTGFDIFCDNETYMKLQLDQASLHVQKRTTYNQTQQCAERLLLLGQTEKSVQLLLETDTANQNFYVDCLRACLTATIQSSGTSLSIVKLVSTNLIASGHIMEGVQLLCLIEKGLDACKYLLGSDKWNDAVWLAKSTLPEHECHEILRRWVDYLSSNSSRHKNKALLVLLTMRQFWKVICNFQQSNMTERAALLLMSCLEFGLIFETEENAADIGNVFSSYDNYLHDLFGTEIKKPEDDSYWWKT